MGKSTSRTSTISTPKEIKDLERIVSMYLDYAENQAARQIPMKMEDWTKKLDAFLQFNEYEMLAIGLWRTPQKPHSGIIPEPVGASIS